MRVIVLIALCFVALISCTPGGAPFEFYVVIKPEETEGFIRAVFSQLQNLGFDARREPIVCGAAAIRARETLRRSNCLIREFAKRQCQIQAFIPAQWGAPRLM